MKKTLFKTGLMLLGGIILFSSCKKDEEEEETVTPTVIKCYLTGGSDNDGNYTVTYNSSNQPTNYSNAGSNMSIDFTWSNGKVTEVKMDSANIPQQKFEVSYSGDQYDLVKIYEYDNSAYSYVGKMSFVYSNGKMTEKKTTDTTGNTQYGKETYTYTGENITTLVEVDDNGTKTTTLTYDDKKNPLGEIGIGFMEYEFLNANNIKTENEGGNSKTYTYEYNSNNYPTKQTGSNGDIETMTYDCK